MTSEEKCRKIAERLGWKLGRDLGHTHADAVWYYDATGKRISPVVDFYTSEEASAMLFIKIIRVYESWDNGCRKILRELPFSAWPPTKEAWMTAIAEAFLKWSETERAPAP